MITIVTKLWRPESAISIYPQSNPSYTQIGNLQGDLRREVIWLRLRAWRLHEIVSRWFDKDNPDRLAWIDVQTQELNFVDTQDLGLLDDYGFDQHGSLYVAGRVERNSDVVLLVYDDKLQVERRIPSENSRPFPQGCYLCVAEDGYLAWYRNSDNSTLSKFSWDNEMLWHESLPSLVLEAKPFDLLDGPTVIAECSRIAVISFDKDGKVLSSSDNGVINLAVADPTLIHSGYDRSLTYSQTPLRVTRGVGANSLLIHYGNRLMHFERNGERKYCIPPPHACELAILPSGRCVATFSTPVEGQNEVVLFEPSFPQKWYDLEPIPWKWW